eukprot:scaffold72910_cov18-Prasinocladus_malaysianus.AAC.1
MLYRYYQAIHVEMRSPLYRAAAMCAGYHVSSARSTALLIAEERHDTCLNCPGYLIRCYYLSPMSWLFSAVSMQPSPHCQAHKLISPEALVRSILRVNPASRALKNLFSRLRSQQMLGMLEAPIWN